jgi:hypothetical protein
MSGSHGDLFGEIGKLVLDAQAGQDIDLSAKAEELAERYRPLGISEEIIARAITRSIGAISFSMARVSLGEKVEEAVRLEVNGNGHSTNGHNGHNGHDPNGHDHDGENGADPSDLPALPKSIFPSGVRLAVLS